jgi:transcriptional regulator with XRE-family HTH domain
MATVSQQKKSEKLRLFSERFKAALGRRNFQDNEIAEKVGVEPSAISNWRQGRNMAKGKNLRRLAEVLDCQPGWLSGEETIEAVAAAGRVRFSDSKDTWHRRALNAEKRLADLRSGLRYLLETSGDSVQLQEQFPARNLPASGGAELLKKPGGLDDLRASG